MADEGIGAPPHGGTEGVQRVAALLGQALLMAMAGRRDAVMALVRGLDPVLLAAALDWARASDLSQMVEAARGLLDGADEPLAFGGGEALPGHDAELLR